MVFKRRTPLTFWQKAVDFFWPRSGLKRAWLYIWYRIARLPGTPYSIAAGFASGAAISFTPFLGLHILLALALTWMLRGNLLAAVIGTVVGNPWTFPLMFALTGQIGSVILGTDVMADVPPWDMSAMMDDPFGYIGAFLPIVFPLIVGGFPVAVIVWFLFYFAFRTLISGYREKRRQQMEETVNKRTLEATKTERDSESA